MLERRYLWLAPALFAGLIGCSDEARESAREGEDEAASDERARGREFPGPETSMEDQLRALEALRLSDGGEPPANVDAALWAMMVPDDNAMTRERVALGRKLYFDTRLSADGSVSCATCHDTTKGLSDHRAASEGIEGQVGRRNAPTTANALFLTTQFLDGRAVTLEDQAKLPILNPIEMGMPSPEAAVAAIADDPEYRRMFQAAYGRDPNYDDVGRAIAAFERTLIFLDAPFDRFLAGDTEAMSEEARAGFVLFNEKARCVSCHPVSPSNPVFSDMQFHNIGVAARHQDFETLARNALAALEASNTAETIDRLALQTDASELGRFLVSSDPSDIGAFKTTQLRNVGITAPYMHDGSLVTLWDVMDHYNKGGEANAHLDGGIVPLDLSETEIDQLVAFMFALTDVRLAELNDSELSRQRGLARERRPIRDEALASRERIQFDPRDGARGQDIESQRGDVTAPTGTGTEDTPMRPEPVPPPTSEEE